MLRRSWVVVSLLLDIIIQPTPKPNWPTRRFEVEDFANRFVPVETVTNVPGFLTNPEGIVPFSPGLPQRGYPGKEAPNHPTPTGLRLSASPGRDAALRRPRMVLNVYLQMRERSFIPSIHIRGRRSAPSLPEATRWSQPRWGCRIGWTPNPG